MADNSTSALGEMDQIWRCCFEVLSMDVAESLLSKTGLSIQRTAPLQRLSQEYVKALYDVPASVPLNSILPRIENELGKNVFEAIHEWVRINHWNYRSEFEASSGWFPLFGRLTLVFDWDAYNFPLVLLPLSESKAQATKIAFLVCLAKEYRLRQTVEAIKRSKLSTWDMYLCSKYPKGTSPFDELSDQVSFIYYMSMWQEIEDSLTASEIEVLASWGQEQAKEILKITQDVFPWTVSPKPVHPPIDVKKLRKRG